ncbi:auxin-responsive protein SAUR78 [Diospyros lotus]|uniref:auxin-responsive protein SAUR78 n=1 Tax=Diospyros lotus TaxID=55363 RepID=UPI00225225F8|nr:auxin-responsive protein SAUR78 [Diospyros lotus]
MKILKLTKLRSALKRRASIGKVDSSVSDSTTEEARVAGNLHAVYVGRSRRRYLIRSEVMEHPLFRVLVERSDGSDGVISVACEVVLFDHLLWMLETAGDSRLDSTDELVEFYSCY